MKHRNLHALAQRLLDVEALRRLDVFEVDAAEGRLQRRHDLDQLVRVLLVDFDVEDIDAGELLEQHGLAFHHRLGRERTDVAEPEHGGAVGDDGDQIAAGGVAVGIDRIVDDFLAGGGDAGRVRQRQIALVDELLGRRDRQLSGDGMLVIFEGGLAKRFAEFHSTLWESGPRGDAPDAARGRLVSAIRARTPSRRRR